MAPLVFTSNDLKPGKKRVVSAAYASTIRLKADPTIDDTATDAPTLRRSSRLSMFVCLPPILPSALRAFPALSLEIDLRADLEEARL